MNLLIRLINENPSEVVQITALNLCQNIAGSSHGLLAHLINFLGSFINRIQSENVRMAGLRILEDIANLEEFPVKELNCALLNLINQSSLEDTRNKASSMLQSSLKYGML